MEKEIKKRGQKKKQRLQRLKERKKGYKDSLIAQNEELVSFCKRRLFRQKDRQTLKDIEKTHFIGGLKKGRQNFWKKGGVFLKLTKEVKK